MFNVFLSSVKNKLKGVLLCSFTKSWFSFGRVLEHDPMLRWFKNRIIFHIIYIIIIALSPACHNDSISSRFDEDPPSEILNVLWLVIFPIALWLAKLRWHFSTALPLAKTASSSILPYQFRSREYWTRELCRTFARTDIARHIKVVMLLLLLLFLAKSCFRWDVNYS